MIKGTALAILLAIIGSFFSCNKDEESPILVESILADPASITLDLGTNSTILASVEPSNAANKNITWTSNNSKIVAVNRSGGVTTVGLGSTEIIIAATDGSGINTTVAVNVIKPYVAVTGISIDKTKLVLEAGEHDMLSAAIAPSNATNNTVRWNTSNPAIATVSAEGKVTGVSLGGCIITAFTDNGNKLTTCLVTVLANVVHVESVALIPTTLTLTVGEPGEQLTATVMPINANNKNLMWESNNPEVAIVTSSGKVTPVSAGSTFITVTTEDFSKQATCQVTVK